MKKKLKEVFSSIKVILIILISTVIVRSYFFTTVKVEGSSMYPSFYDGDLIGILKIGYTLDLFDNIVFNTPEEDYYIKRIIGVPGQIVWYENNYLYIDNEIIEETFLDRDREPFPFTEDFNLEDICNYNNLENCDVIPEGFYLILGDNRLNSKDSRIIGLIKEDQILGKVIFNLTEWKH